MLPYIHRVFQLDNESRPSREWDVIKTKKAFNAAMITHFFTTLDPERLGFRLDESPNSSFYEIFPYVNRRGNPAIAFVIRDSKPNTTGAEDHNNPNVDSVETHDLFI